MARTRAASVDAFEIYIIEDWMDSASTRYYVGSSFHAKSKKRFDLHVAGKGSAKHLSEEIAKHDANWTVRVLETGFGTWIDAITAESGWFNKMGADDPRHRLNRQDPLTQERTHEAQQAAGYGLAATGYHQSEYGQQIHSELGILFQSRLTPEERRQNGKRITENMTPEERSENGRKGAKIGRASCRA